MWLMWLMQHIARAYLRPRTSKQNDTERDRQSGAIRLMKLPDISSKMGPHKLGRPIDRNDINRCHRLGRQTSELSNKPIAVIVKTTSRNDISMDKRKLKGTTIGIDQRKHDENAKRTVHKAPNVATTWTTDGMIVCLLTSGKKVAITIEQELRGISQC